MQRLRIKFSRNEEIKFLAHLDLMRLWERVFRRTGIALAYSEGFNPHPRISLAAPLQVGASSQGELMDVWLAGWISPDTFTKKIQSQLPAGIGLIDMQIVPPELPSLQASVKFAEYLIAMKTDNHEAEIQSMIRWLLDKQQLKWHHLRNNEERHYDIRALIDDIWFVSVSNGICLLGMRLRCDSGGTGRPEQVLKAMGFTSHPVKIHRTRLVL